MPIPFPCSANIAAFNLPWLAKYYGLDWKTDSLTAAQSAADSLAKAEAERLSAGKAGDADSYTLSLRANLLRWATLTPDLGIEWRISPSVGVMVNGSWTSWTWNDNARRYALWEVMPEVRWYLGEKKAWYVGAMFKAGQFNYKFRQRDETLDWPDQRRRDIGLEIILNSERFRLTV